MAKLVLRDGKFFRGSEEVPPIIGDEEQIALLQAQERRLNFYEKNGSPVEFDIRRAYVYATMKFTCCCGEKIEKKCETTVYDVHNPEDELLECWEHDTIECKICNREYRFEDGDAKVINKSETE